MFLGQIIGTFIVVVGSVLLITGYNASERMVHHISEPAIGRQIDETTWYLISGIAGVVGGSLLMMLDRRN